MWNTVNEDITYHLSIHHYDLLNAFCLPGPMLRVGNTTVRNAWAPAFPLLTPFISGYIHYLESGCIY